MSTIDLYLVFQQYPNGTKEKATLTIEVPEHNASFLGEVDQILDKIDFRFVIPIPISFLFQWITSFFKRKKKGTAHKVNAGSVYFHFTVSEPKVTVTRGAQT